LCIFYRFIYWNPPSGCCVIAKMVRKNRDFSWKCVESFWTLPAACNFDSDDWKRCAGVCSKYLHYVGWCGSRGSVRYESFCSEKSRFCNPCHSCLDGFHSCDGNCEHTSVFPVQNIVYSCVESGVARGFCASCPIRGGFVMSTSVLWLGRQFLSSAKDDDFFAR